MVPTIKGDRIEKPWVVLWGDWLHRLDVPEYAPPLPLGNTGGIYHVHHFDLWRELLLSPYFRWPRILIIVIALRPLLLVFGIQLAGLFENPTFFVGMIGWFTGGAVDLTWAIEYAFQIGRARIVSLNWLLPLTGLRATESCLRRCHHYLNACVCCVGACRCYLWLQKCQVCLNCCCCELASYLRPHKRGS